MVPPDELVITSIRKPKATTATNEAVVDTCYLCGKPLGPKTKPEHTIPRALGGRFRSQRVSCDRHNNLAGSRLDEPLTAAYRGLLAVLSPLLPSEVGSTSLDVTLDEDTKGFQLGPGGVIEPKRMVVLERAEDGRPKHIIASTPERIRQFCTKQGIPPEKVIVGESSEMPGEGWWTGSNVISAEIESAVLRAALLTFDHVLADDPSRRFTRTPEVQKVRAALRDLLDGTADEVPALGRWMRGVNVAVRDQLLALRRGVVDQPESEFEHVLYARVDTDRKLVELVVVIMGVDAFQFRLACGGDVAPFTVVVGCGIQKSTRPFGPTFTKRTVELQDTWARSTWDSPVYATERARTDVVRSETASVIESHREAFQRATLLVERRADEFLIDALRRLAMPSIEIPATFRSISRERLRRLYAHCLASPDETARFDQIVLRPRGGIDPVLGADVPPGGEATWWRERAQVLLAAHRLILEDVVQEFGLPSRLNTRMIEVDRAA